MGNYIATLHAAGIIDPAGNPLADDVQFQFRFLMADANDDGAVNLQDFNILAANFGLSHRSFSDGDFNYDGVVDLDDFNILAGRFGAGLFISGRPATGACAQPRAGAPQRSEDPLLDLLR